MIPGHFVSLVWALFVLSMTEHYHLPFGYELKKQEERAQRQKLHVHQIIFKCSLLSPSHVTNGACCSA